MKKQKKFLAVLSAAAVSTMIAAAVSTTAFAKTTDVIAKIDGQEVKINFEELTTAYENKAAGLDSELFNKYNEREGLTALLDDTNGFVDYKAVQEAAEDAVALGEKFVLNDFTENTEKTLADFKPEAEWKDDKVVPVTPVEEDLKVESVSAINPTTVKVVFNKEVEELAKADVVVTNVKTSEKQYVKEVKLAEDKKSAEISFYDALATKNTYKVVAAGAEKEFDFVIGDVAKIEAKTVQVVPTEATAIEYKVLDANGLDITATTDVTFESTASDKIDKDGKITLADKETAFVYVVYTDKDGNKIKSNRITVKAEAAKPAEISDYTVAKNANFDADDYKQNLVLQKGAEGQKVHVLVKDQFGKKIDNPVVSYESLDKTIVLVDRTNGGITPLKEGSVPVRITVGDITKTIEIKVVADAKAAAVELDKNEISISNQVQTPEEVKVTVKDQYDNVFETNEKLTVKVTSGSDLVTVANELSLTKGVGTLEVKPADKTKSGKAVIEIAVSEKVKTTLEVEVTEAGIVDNYVVEGFKAELDKNDDKDNKNKEMTLSVFPVDANGVKTGDAVAEAKMTVTDKDGKAVTGLKDVNVGEIATTNLKADETYTVSVKVGTIEVFKDSFKVVDTTKKSVIEQKTSNIEIKADAGDVEGALKAAFLKDGKALGDKDTVEVASSDNVAVIKLGEASKAEIVKPGNATLVISKVADQEVDNLIVNVTVKPVIVEEVKDDTINAVDYQKVGKSVTIPTGDFKGKEIAKGDFKVTAITESEKKVTNVNRLAFGEGSESQGVSGDNITTTFLYTPSNEYADKANLSWYFEALPKDDAIEKLEVEVKTKDGYIYKLTFNVKDEVDTTPANE
ncbi:hypothetical protein [Clostridium cochlearium]|uniref:hypothetical protein n=1 Tax=Clostridium cochlearium TaxID=1494 RepID=UPI000B9475D2|nr:hypothetical protein [Clostridium cochlearium]SNV66973.1 Ig domain-containing protein [Clostridium cochlearium]STA91585.1 Ig domain-containing protein [Clostridium cochlearium]